MARADLPGRDHQRGAAASPGLFLSPPCLKDVIGTLEMTAGRVDAGTGMLVLGGDVTISSDVLGTSSEVTGRLSMGSGPRTFNVAGSLQLHGQMMGTFHLHQLGSYSGITTINQGAIRIYHASALGMSSAGTVVNPGGQLWLSGYSGGIVEELTLAGEGVNGTGALRVSGTNFCQANITLAGDTTVNVATNSLVQFNGSIQGSGDLTFQGDGKAVMAGTVDNNYNGTTIGLIRKLALVKQGGATAISGPLIIGRATNDFSPPIDSVVDVDEPQQIVNNAPVAVHNTGQLEISKQETIGSLTLIEGDVVAGSGSTPGLILGGDITALTTNDHCYVDVPLLLGGATRTFYVKGLGALIFRRPISSGGGNAGFIKTGPSSLDLYKTNSYVGPTIIQTGIVHLAYHATLGTAAGGTIINAGAMLDFGFNGDLAAEPITLNGHGYGYGALVGYGTNISIKSIPNAAVMISRSRTGYWLNDHFETLPAPKPLVTITLTEQKQSHEHRPYEWQGCPRDRRSLRHRQSHGDIARRRRRTCDGRRPERDRGDASQRSHSRGGARCLRPTA